MRYRVLAQASLERDGSIVALNVQAYPMLRREATNIPTCGCESTAQVAAPDEHQLA